LQNLHLADCQPNANFIRLVAGRMQTIDKFGYFVLHGSLPDAICIRLAVIWMKFASRWWPTE
jgi:hypothetical protein